MIKIISIIGARPQFIKSFPFEKAANGKVNLMTIHTGQHYDQNMSQVFFDEFGMKKPDYLLNLGGGMHGEQTGKMLFEIENILIKESPDFVLVFGDTNSTLAGALAAAKLNIKIIHVEAGLRSFNKSMPEEINRVLTDHISTLLYVPSNQPASNLAKEGITKNVFNVGDIMKDVVKIYKDSFSDVPNEKIGEEFIYTTLHRPYNTDDPLRLKYILESLNKIGKRILFSIHPRTNNLLDEYNIPKAQFGNIEFCNPLGYFENLKKLDRCSTFITDSGGMQKEAYWLKKKCITIRTETEWVETLENSWNTLVFENLEELSDLVNVIPGNYTELYGEGNTGVEIVSSILSYANEEKK
ncbi:UDP-N-acetylglucosamine 2-epimerase (non-hydrolyzing) [Aquiflexum sp. TKW24L]|uniref:non-hydrolyzing UDP-N-acetylglucosamine 2-epimerase n=1 Tax=Aquiflexum sp. TKW24L TaxID=2942212 RepID=UPI0020BE8576|nr:UDP-N-acetylglucosamine 2-epimerase (non-hydrolyzing) [Aquiflexum sp. TKW24L]MCL6260014.1 UDP-N-acetylglucosamine 2-epimerase (non-hydrolyzing) [Aquiflexum sp. TKW24L]